MARTHALKTLPEFFVAIVDGIKTFEVRKDDRDFQAGDKLLLQEYDDKDKMYTGEEWEGVITYVMNDPAFCKKGFVIFGIKETQPNY